MSYDKSDIVTLTEYIVYFNFRVLQQPKAIEANKGKRVLRLISYFRTKLGTDDLGRVSPLLPKSDL